MPENQQPSAEETLAIFLKFADEVIALKPEPYVYTETCSCGGSVAVGREASSAERRRICAAFFTKHRTCVTSPEGGRES